MNTVTWLDGTSTHTDERGMLVNDEMNIDQSNATITEAISEIRKALTALESLVSAGPATPSPAAQEGRADDWAVAKSLGDLVTPKQLAMIRAVARDANINAGEECSKLMNCSISELSKRAASDLIDHLQTLCRNLTPATRHAA